MDRLTATSRDAELAVDRWQLCYSAGPVGFCLGLGGLLTIRADVQFATDIGEIHLCNGQDTQRFFSNFKDVPSGAIGGIDMSGGGAIIVRDGDPVLIYNLLEDQQCRRLAGQTCSAMSLLMKISETQDAGFFAVRDLGFYV